MKKQEREQVRVRLVNEISRTRQDVEQLKEVTRPVVFEDMDDITHMDSIVNKSVNDAALASARSRLAALEYALKHLEDPEFGICAECGESIPLPRLLSMPQSNLCVDCAE